MSQNWPQCYHCSNPLNPDSAFGRQETCAKCGRSTRICLNCLHYDPSRYNECKEPVADRVVDKEKSNFCDYFKPGSPSERSNRKGAQANAISAAEALFKKK